MINDLDSNSGSGETCKCLLCQASDLEDKLKAEGRLDEADVVRRLKESHGEAGDLFDSMREIDEQRFYQRKPVPQRLAYWRQEVARADDRHSELHCPERHARIQASSTSPAAK